MVGNNHHTCLWTTGPTGLGLGTQAQHEQCRVSLGSLVERVVNERIRVLCIQGRVSAALATSHLGASALVSLERNGLHTLHVDEPIRLSITSRF